MIATGSSRVRVWIRCAFVPGSPPVKNTLYSRSAKAQQTGKLAAQVIENPQRRSTKSVQQPRGRCTDDTVPEGAPRSESPACRAQATREGRPRRTPRAGRAAFTALHSGSRYCRRRQATDRFSLLCQTDCRDATKSRRGRRFRRLRRTDRKPAISACRSNGRPRRNSRRVVDASAGNTRHGAVRTPAGTAANSGRSSSSGDGIATTATFFPGGRLSCRRP